MSNGTNEGFLELFEFVKQGFLMLPLDEFTKKVQNENKLYFYFAFASTPLFSDWNTFENLKNTAITESYPILLREDAYKNLKYKVDEIITKIKSGSVSVPKKRIAEEVVNSISDPKVKKICLELNNTPDENVLSLAQSLGEALKWTLWYRARQLGISPKRNDLGPLLKEATGEHGGNPYYYDNAVCRFLDDFKNNFLKTIYDMVRHDLAYIPDIVVLNPAIDALEHVLRVTFLCP